MILIDKAEVLLPCPFCGGGVSVTTTERVGGIVCDAPSECIGSGLLIVFDLEDMETALAAWNRRAIPARGVGVPTEAQFMDAVWAALKADATDLGKQQRILAAFRAALAPTDAAQAPAEDAHVKGETAGQMLERLGIDGAKWAAEFRTTALRLGYSDMDEGWLVGWFCNAIMAGHDRSAAQAREAALHPDGFAALAPTDYTLAPHLQKIVDGAKTAPQWDTQADRLTIPATTDAPHVNETPKSEHGGADVLTDAAQAREAALHPDDMLPEAIRLIRQEASRDHSQDVVTGLKHIALLLEQLINEART